MSGLTRWALANYVIGGWVNFKIPVTIGGRVFFVSESLKTVKAILAIVNVKTTLSFCDLYVERGDHIFSGILPLVPP